MMTTQRARTHIVVAALCWLLIGSYVLWANQVQSGWVFYVVLGLPGYVLGELFFGWLLSRRHGLALSRARFSFARIAAALLAAIVFVVVSLWVSSVLPA
jgi:uncharacterized membrane protein YeaQ/YmgE (transglycosylase-associated protein family)